jgi:hypothetical protein
MRFIIPVQFRFLKIHGVYGIAIFPFLILKNKNLVFDKIFLNHEKIHFRQQLELLVIPYYFIYAAEFLANLYIYKDVQIAQANVCFEREAFEMQQDLDYLRNRKIWAFLNWWLD